MKTPLAITFIFLMTLALSVSAQEKIIDYDIFATEKDLAIDHKAINISQLSVTKVVKKVLDRGENFCNDVESSCERFLKIEEEKVVQLILSFEKSIQRYEDLDNFDYVKFNFPLNDFSAETLEKIKRINSSIMTSKKKEETKKLVTKLFVISGQKIKKNVDVIDLERSVLCETGLGDAQTPNCEDQIVLKKDEITVDRIKVVLK